MAIVTAGLVAAFSIVKNVLLMVVSIVKNVLKVLALILLFIIIYGIVIILYAKEEYETYRERKTTESDKATIKQQL